MFFFKFNDVVGVEEMNEIGLENWSEVEVEVWNEVGLESWSGVRWVFLKVCFFILVEIVGLVECGGCCDCSCGGGGREMVLVVELFEVGGG